MPNIAALITIAAVMFAVLTFAGSFYQTCNIYKLNNIKSKTVAFVQSLVRSS